VGIALKHQKYFHWEPRSRGDVESCYVNKTEAEDASHRAVRGVQLSGVFEAKKNDQAKKRN